MQEEEEQLGCMCISALSSTANPGLLNTVALDSIFAFFQYFCLNPSSTTTDYWNDEIQKRGGVVRQQAGSDEMKPTSEVLSTNLHLASYWNPDNMVREVRQDEDSMTSARFV